MIVEWKGGKEMLNVCVLLSSLFRDGHISRPADCRYWRGKGGGGGGRGEGGPMQDANALRKGKWKRERRGRRMMGGTDGGDTSGANGMVSSHTHSVMEGCGLKSIAAGIMYSGSMSS